MIKRTVITMCGSTRFADLMAAISWEMEKLGYIVLRVNFVPDWYTWNDNWTESGHGAEQSGLKAQLDVLHCRKIDMSDLVFVCNPNDYVGESTEKEIKYALSEGKRVLYLYGSPNEFTDMANKMLKWAKEKGSPNFDIDSDPIHNGLLKHLINPDGLDMSETYAGTITAAVYEYFKSIGIPGKYLSENGQIEVIETLLSSVRNKLTPFFNLAAIISSGEEKAMPYALEEAVKAMKQAPIVKDLLSRLNHYDKPTRQDTLTPCEVLKIVMFTIKEWASINEQQEKDHKQLVSAWLNNELKDFVRKNTDLKQS